MFPSHPYVIAAALAARTTELHADADARHLLRIALQARAARRIPAARRNAAPQPPNTALAAPAR